VESLKLVDVTKDNRRRKPDETPQQPPQARTLIIIGDIISIIGVTFLLITAFLDLAIDTAFRP
jgi:hypothetical protein